MLLKRPIFLNIFSVMHLTCKPCPFKSIDGSNETCYFFINAFNSTIIYYLNCIHPLYCCIYQYLLY